MSVPSHPDQDDDIKAERPGSRRTLVVIGVVVVLLIAVIALHLAGVVGH